MVRSLTYNFSQLALEQLLEMYNPNRNYIAKNLRKKYCDAYFMNNFQRCSDLLRASRKISFQKERKHKHLRAQSLFSPMENFNNMCDKFANFAEEGASITSNVNGMLDSIKAYFSSDRDLFDKSLSIMSATALLYTSKRDVMSVVAFLVNVAANFGVTGEVIKQIFVKWVASGITSLVSQGPSLRAQADDSAEEEFGIFGAIAETICTLMGVKTTMAGFMNGLGMVGRGLTGLEKINSLILYCFKWLRNTVWEFYYGTSYDAYLEISQFPGLEEFIQACQLLQDIKQEYIDTNREICNLILAVNRLGNELLQESRKESTLRTYINTLLRQILPFVEKAKCSPATAKTSRNMPYALYIYGPAGVGKTNLMHILMARMYKQYVKNYVPGFANCYHSRKAENEYFDGYLRQPFLLYDDIFQVKDTTASPNPEVMEIIRAINDDPYQLHMASVEDKKTCYMDSDFVLATSNAKIPKIESISCPDAVYRRFGTAIEVSVKPEFGVEIQTSSTTKYYRVDPNKVKSTLETDIYIITEYSMNGGNVIRRYEFEEFVTELFTRIDRHRTTHDSRLTLLRGLAGEENIEVDTSECLQYQQQLADKLAGLRAQGSDPVRESCDAMVADLDIIPEHETWRSTVAKFTRENRLPDPIYTIYDYYNWDITDNVQTNSDAEEVFGLQTDSEEESFSYVKMNVNTENQPIGYQACLTIFPFASDPDVWVQPWMLEERKFYSWNFRQGHHYPTVSEAIESAALEGVIWFANQINRDEDRFWLDLEAQSGRGMRAENAQREPEPLEPLSTEEVFNHVLGTFNRENSILAEIRRAPPGTRKTLAERLAEKIDDVRASISMTLDGFIPMFDAVTISAASRLETAKDVSAQVLATFREKFQGAINKALEWKFHLLLPLLVAGIGFLYKYYQCPLKKLKQPTDIYTISFCRCERCVFIRPVVEASGGYENVALRFDESLTILGILLQQYPDEDLIRLISPMLLFRGRNSNRVYKHLKAETSASGDFKTLATGKKLNAENASGDFTTKAVPRTLIAEFNAGDEETKKTFIEALKEQAYEVYEFFRRSTAFLYADTDNLTDATNSIEINGVTVAQVGDLNQVEQWNSTVARNIVLLEDDRQVSSVNAVFVTGRVILAPYHFYNTSIDKRDKFLLRNPFQQNLKTPIAVNQCFFHRVVDKEGEHTDAVLIALPLSIPSRPNIVEKFTKASDMSKLAEGEVVLAGLNTLRGVPVVKTTTAVKSRAVTKQVSYPDAYGNTYSINSSIVYDATTAPGDCGALLFARNPLIAGKILGMHVAGDTSRGYGFSVAISRENLARNLEAFALKVNDTRQFVKGNFAAEMAVVDPCLAYKTLGDLGDYLPVGHLTDNPGRPIHTVLNKSLIHNMIYETETKPAYLTPQKVDGEFVDPLMKGIKKVCNVLPIVNQRLLDIAVHDVKKQYTHTEKDLQRVLTYEEALQGVENYEFAAPINRSTSPGYPYSVGNTEGGKHKWLGYDDDWVLDNPILKQDVKNIIDRARKNVRSDVIFTATLKDERRPIAKVNELKTRVFEAAPLPYVVAMRQYFLGFVEHVMRNRIQNEVCVGTNHLSLDWHLIGLKLSSKSNDVIAGDFSNFDGTLHQQILWKICEIINEWYRGTEEETLIRNVLFEEVCNTIVNLDGTLIQQTHSQPSGNPLTVIINSVYNQIVMRYAYLLCKKDAGLPVMCDFVEKVGFVTYGDDNAANIARDVLPWYNQETITKALATIGLTYTDETKSGVVQKSRSLADINFLKRKFVKDEWGYWKAPILINVPRDMCNWVRGKEIRASTLLNCNASLMEFALHGRDVYEEETRKLITVCEQMNVPLSVPHYEEWVSFFASHRGITV